MGRAGKTLAVGLPAFSVTIGLAIVDSARMRLAAPPRLEEVAVIPGAPRAVRKGSPAASSSPTSSTNRGS